MSGIIFKQGDIWLVPFPYSDFNSYIKRPVLIISNNHFNEYSKDLLVCQITTKIRNDLNSILLEQKNLKFGSLPKISEIRCHKINILSKSKFLKKYSEITEGTYSICENKINKLISKEFV